MTQHLDIATGPAGPGNDLLAAEWLLTNGRGSYCASTVVGASSRKYHGLLVSAIGSPGERAVLLATLAEELVVGSNVYPLACFEFRDVFQPRGDRLLAGFDRDADRGTVRFTYRVGDLTLTKTIVLARQAEAVSVRYELSGAAAHRQAFKSALLRVRPFFAYRHYHANRRGGGPGGSPEASAAAVLADATGDILNLTDPDRRLPPMHIHLAGAFTPQPQWWYRFFYRLEAARGEDPWEDLFTPGQLELKFAAASDEAGPAAAEFRAARDPFAPISFAEAVQTQREHRDELLGTAQSLTAPTHPHPGPVPERERENLSHPPPLRDTERGSLSDLVLAADDFVVQAVREPGYRQVTTILAGFPWFADWGRDAFIALPGLLLATGRAELARGVLLRFGGAIHNGLVPNRFSDDPEGGRFHPCDYNSVDSSLWFIHAAFAWAAATGDWATFDARLLGPVRAILDAYHRGTEFSIRVDADGLLTCGTGQTQLTWMDAMVDGRPITPRAGKPVEVNALYGHALKRTADRLGAVGSPDAKTYAERLAKWHDSFVYKFPSPRGGLYDCIDPDGQPNDLIRPNQLLAVSLDAEASGLPAEVQKEVVQVAREHLLTPFGLRTLAPSDPGYQGRCTGSRRERDRAYHQGTVWPWLIGSFVEAHLRVNGFSDDAKQQAASWIQPLLEYMNGPGQGQIPEIFDGDPPHTPRGCFAQAWSVAEVLRVLTMIGTADERR